MSEKMYVVFLKAIITFIVALIWLVLFLLAKAGGIMYLAYGVSIVAVMFLAWLWSPENYGGKK